MVFFTIRTQSHHVPPATLSVASGTSQWLGLVWRSSGPGKSYGCNHRSSHGKWQKVTCWNNWCNFHLSQKQRISENCSDSDCSGFIVHVYKDIVRTHNMMPNTLHTKSLWAAFKPRCTLQTPLMGFDNWSCDLLVCSDPARRAKPHHFHDMKKIVCQTC